MPRIRTIKPEFWTDSKVVSLTTGARLFFIGMWNFADDFGCLPVDRLQVRLQILPANGVDVDDAIDQLLALGLIREMVSTEGIPFWHITNWERHQLIAHRKSLPWFGDPSTWRPSSSDKAPTLSDKAPTLSNKVVPLLGGRKEGRKGKEGPVTRRQAAREPENVSDGLWTALEELFGPVTESHRSRRGKIVKGLRALNAAPEDIKRRARYWPLLFAGSKLTLTDTALEKFWGNLGLLVEADQREVALPDCDICRNRRQVGVTNEGHLVVWDDEYAVGWKPCRCVKGAK